MTIEIIPGQPEPEQPSSSFAALLPDEPFNDFPVSSAGNGAEPTGGAFGQSDAAPPPDREAKEAKRTRRIKLSRKMQKSMDKIRNVGADALVHWFHDQAKQQPEWELDAKEEEVLRDSMETVFDVLDIEIMVEPIGMELTSIWWVIAYPFATFLYLFFSKKAKIAKPEEPEA